MPDLYITTRKGNEHRHIVYLNEKTGTGQTSVSKGHSHQVVYEPAFPNTIDNMTAGMPLQDMPVQTPSGFIWRILEQNGHAHEYSPYPVKTEKIKEDDVDIVEDVLTLFKEAKEYESESRKKAEESEGFYFGDEQWDKKVKQNLTANQRSALVLNEIEPKIDLLSGYQRQNRTDFRFLPIEGGDQRVADILNVVVKVITEQTNYPHEESLVFEDECIAGRGCFEIYENYDKNILGDIVIERYPWKDIYFGPHEKYDLSDCEYIIKGRWYSIGKLKELWPERAGDVQKTLDELVSSEHTTYSGDQYSQSINIRSAVVSDADLVDIQRKEYRVLECQRKTYRKDYVVINVVDDFYYNAEGWDKSDIEQIKTIPNFSIIPKVSYNIRVTKTCAVTLLDDTYSDSPVQDFSIVPVYAKKRGKKWQGKVEAAKDPQREINKRHSQVTDIVNKMVAYGWFIDENTFLSKQDEEKFRNTSSTAGGIFKIQDANKPPQQMEGVKFPNDLVELMQMESSKIKELMNINLELLGQQAGQPQSGIAIMQQKQQGLIGNEFLFDNLRIAKKKLAKHIIALMQGLFTSERILRIVENENMKNPVQLAGQPLFPQPPQMQSQPQDISPQGQMQQGGMPPQMQAMMQQQAIAMRRQEIINLLENSDLTKYDIAIAEAAYNPTTRLANFFIWADLAGKGIPVPPDMLVELSELPEKEKVIQSIQAMQQQQMQIEQQKSQMEIGKTLIAAQSKQAKPMPRGGM